MILSPPMLPIPPNRLWKMHGYFCNFKDSEPAHAPHPTEQMMKNACILLYFQWFWARPCSPSHRTNHAKCMDTIVFSMILSPPMFPIPPNKSLKNYRYYYIFNDSEPAHAPPSHRTNHVKCMDTIVFSMILSPPMHRTNHEKCMHTIVFSVILSPPMLAIPPNKSSKMHGYYCIFNDSEPAHAPHHTERIMKMYGYYCIFNDSEPAHAAHHTERIMKMYGYYCIFNDSEPAHAPHPTEHIMKNA